MLKDATLVRRISHCADLQILSLHSPALSEILYKDGQLTKEIHLDIDLNSYRSFLHSIIGEFPTSAYFCIWIKTQKQICSIDN